MIKATTQSNTLKLDLPTGLEPCFWRITKMSKGENVVPRNHKGQTKSSDYSRLCCKKKT